MFINNQITLQEKLLAYHGRAYTTLDTLLAANLKGYPASILHLYVWEIRDMMGEAKKLNQSILNSLYSILKFVEASKKPSNGNSGTVY